MTGGGRLQVSADRRIRNLPACVVALAMASLAQPAAAQVTAGALPNRQELRAGAPTSPAPPPPPRTRLRFEDRIERSPCPLDDPKFANLRVSVSKAEFTGLGPVSAEQLAGMWQPYAGSDQPVGVICRIRDAAATRLRELGYVASVEVPVQRIEGGVVRFAVLYARVTAVRVVGRPGRNAALLEGYLKGLADGEVFNRFRAERHVLLAQDIPGYDLHLALKPAGTGAGNMIAEVRVDSQAVQADLAITNLAAPVTGRFGGQARVAFNGLTGMGDQTTLSAYSTADFVEQQIYQVGHRMRLGHGGFELAGNFTYALTRPDIGVEVRASTRYYNLEARYPFVRRQALSLSGTLGLDVVDQDVRLVAVGPLSRDRLRIVYARLDLDAMDLDGKGPGGSVLWRLSGNAELRQGVSILGGSPNCRATPAACAVIVTPSISQGNPMATVFRAGAEFDVRPLKWLSLAFTPKVQLSSGPLLAFEQYQLGNYTLGRGFNPGTLAGDDGAGFGVELRGPVMRPSGRLKLTAQPYLFSDNGWARQRLAPNGQPQELHSLGGGARLNLADRGRLDMVLAVPVNRVAGEADVRGPLFLMTLTANLTPGSNR